MSKQDEIDALYDAAWEGDLAGVKAKLAAGVKIDGRHKWGKTPIWAAAQQGQAEVFFYLLDKGANPNVRHPEHDWNPLADSVGNGDEKIVDRERMFHALLNSSLGKDPAVVQRAMLAACCSGSAKMVQGLIDAGANVNAEYAGGYLIPAVVDNDNRNEVVPVLLAAGIDTTIKRPRSSYDDADDKKKVGKTADAIALMLGYKRLAKQIQSASAKQPKAVAKPRPKPPRSIDEAWDRIEAWLVANAKGWKPLRPKATDVQIAKAEKSLGIKLPADVRASYRRHNGSDDHGFFPDHAGANVSWYLLSVPEIVGEAEEWEELLDDGDFDDSKPKADKGVRREAWNKRWIPFAGNGGGDCWCLDLAPASGGKAGQVIYVSHEMAQRERLAKSFSEWLGKFAIALEAGDYRYEKGKGLISR